MWVYGENGKTTIMKILQCIGLGLGMHNTKSNVIHYGNSGSSLGFPNLLLKSRMSLRSPEEADINHFRLRVT